MNKLILLILVISLTACGNSQKGKSSATAALTGAGATFPLPYYNLAFKTYQDSARVFVTYGGIGSGGGIRSLKDQIVDFGGTDAFLTDAEISQLPGKVIQIPTCIGAVVLAYNLPEIKSLKLNGTVVADIFLGKITQWNDPRIAALNPETSLPDQPIHPVYRSDGSGTTYVFSDYLTKVSPEWKSKVGTGKALKWPTGIAVKGNPGVAGTISQSVGAIGYIGSEYAFALNIPMAALQNQAGHFILPDAKSISAAAQGEIPEDTRVMLTNSTQPEAYPISCFTWIAIYRQQAYKDRSLQQAKATVKLLEWMIGDEAQSLTTKVHYSPLPESVRTQAGKLLKTVTYNQAPLLK